MIKLRFGNSLKFVMPSILLSGLIGASLLITFLVCSLECFLDWYYKYRSLNIFKQLYLWILFNAGVFIFIILRLSEIPPFKG